MAVGASTFSNAGGAVSDLFAGIGNQYKAKGARIEQRMYESDAEFATQNAQYTETSTAIKLAQQSRANALSQSQTEANIAGAGLKNSGSALNILASNASQGELTKQVLQQQGIITEEGYKQQAEAYTDQAEAAGVAAEGAKAAETGSFISGALKGVAAIASIGLAPLTGGASLALGAAAAGAMSGTGGLY